MVLWEIRILTGQLGEHRLKMEVEPWTVGGGGGGGGEADRPIHLSSV